MTQVFRKDVFATITNIIDISENNIVHYVIT